MTKYERKVFLHEYDRAVLRLGFILLLITLAILAISYSVFKSIQFDHTKLELATKKLQRVNKKLRTEDYIYK